MNFSDENFIYELTIVCGLIFGNFFSYYHIIYILCVIISKRKQKEARIQKKIEDKKALKKNQAMVQPTYRVDPEIKDLDEDHHEKT